MEECVFRSQIPLYKIGIYCFSAKHVALGRRMVCPNGATCLSTDCCFGELALYGSNSACWSSAGQPYRHLIEN